MRVENASQEKFDIIIVAGQSNASGCGKGETLIPYELNDRIKMLNSPFTAKFLNVDGVQDFKITLTDYCRIDLADDRFSEGEKQASFCLSFAKKYLENNLEEDRKILLVQTAIGATSFSEHHWGENERLSNRMFEMVNAALSMNKENRIVAVLWHQGESDIGASSQLSYEERKDFYFSKLKKFIENLRKEYGVVPFISASFCNDWLSTVEKDRVNAILDSYKEILSIFDKTAHVWNVEDLVSNLSALKTGNDNIHFCRDSAYKLGLRYYEKYIDLVKGE